MVYEFKDKTNRNLHSNPSVVLLRELGNPAEKVKYHHPGGQGRQKDVCLRNTKGQCRHRRPGADASQAPPDTEKDRTGDKIAVNVPILRKKKFFTAERLLATFED